MGTILSYFKIVICGKSNLVHQCVTVSTKIPKQLKEKIQKFKIKPSKILRKALEDEVKKREVEELKLEIDKLKPILDKVSAEDIVKSIREDRDSR
jgi:antitoxin CcdA